MPSSATRLVVNGTTHDVTAAPDTPLLYVLRNELVSTVRSSAADSDSAARAPCTSTAAPVRSCVTPSPRAAGGPSRRSRDSARPTKPHPLQQAFIDEQAAQCGYCINGMIMAGRGARSRERSARRATEIRDALNGNLCRCGTHMRIVRAVERARR